MRNPVIRFLEARWFTGKPSPSPRASGKPSGKPSAKASPKLSPWWKRESGPSHKPSNKPSNRPSAKASPAYKPDYPSGPSQKANTLSLCRYSGKQPDTEYCKEETTIDGCTHYSYDVTKTTLDLTKGNEFERDGYVEFSYIPLEQYNGWGSAASPDPDWKPVKAKIEFGSKQ